MGVLSAHWLSAIENALIAQSDSPHFSFLIKFWLTKLDYPPDLAPYVNSFSIHLNVYSF